MKSKSTISKGVVGIVFFAVLFIAPQANAQQGCCSWHNGIDYCDSDGYYMCKDGTQSPSCTCTYSAPKSLYDLSSQIALQGKSACSSIPALKQSANTTLDQINNNIQKVNNDRVSAVNRINAEKKKAVDSMTASYAISGAWGSSSAQNAIRELETRYTNLANDTAKQYEFQEMDYQLKAKEYKDFIDFLTSFQQKICDSNSNSSNLGSPTTKSVDSSKYVECNNKSIVTSDGKNCICKPGFSTISGQCTCPDEGYIDNLGYCQITEKKTYQPSAKRSGAGDPKNCISINPCKCLSGYKPVGNKSCAPIIDQEKNCNGLTGAKLRSCKAKLNK